MNLKDYLSQHFHLPTEITDDLIFSGERKTFAKGEVILPTNSISKNIYFVENGLVKMFYYKEDKSITHHFLTENKFITRSENFYKNNLQNKTSIYGLTALENQTVIFQIPFQKVKNWTENSLEMNKLIQQILVDILRSFSNRLNKIQFENAQERYQQLLAENPEIILRAPLGDIASYLGISQQTLSVIRSQVK